MELLDVGAVVNVTAGDRRVPNVFAGRKRREGGGEIEYAHYELQDLAGANLESVLEGALPRIAQWIEQGTPTLVHCSAGLSRSASVVLAHRMTARRETLAQAVDYVQRRRGRRLQVNPSFWMVLAARERLLHGLPPGTPPSFDFTPWWLEDFGAMGFAEEKIIHALHVEGDWVHFPRAFDSMLSQ